MGISSQLWPCLTNRPLFHLSRPPKCCSRHTRCRERRSGQTSQGSENLEPLGHLTSCNEVKITCHVAIRPVRPSPHRSVGGLDRRCNQKQQTGCVPTPRAQQRKPGVTTQQESEASRRLIRGGEQYYSPATISAMSSPASVGLSPTFTPASRSASILASAVPLPPETMAPAWPIFFPGGAVTPAT